MRKVLFLMLMMSVVLTVRAQGEWKVVTTEADDLKGTTGGEVYIYSENDVGDFVVWDWKEPQFRLICSQGQFNINSGYSSYTGAYAFVTVLIGLYDDDGKLIEKFDMNLDRESNKANQFIYANTSRIGHKKKIKKIFESLQSGKGYVRIVAPRYNRTDFDMKIPPYTK